MNPTTESPFDTAQRTLLAANDLDTAQVESIFGLLAAHKLDDADLYFQYSRSEAWSLEEGQVKSGSFNIDQPVFQRISDYFLIFHYQDFICFS